jgi:transmembrane sensor
MGKTYADIDLARYFSGEYSPEEKLEVEAWSNENSENKEIFNSTRVIWERTLKAGAIDFNTEDALTKVHVKLESKDQKENRRIIPLYLKIVAFAAAILLPLLIIFNKGGKDQSSEIAFNTFVTTETVKQLQLADGSLVWINRNSTLSVPKEYNGGNYTIKLEGEAYFQVAHNPSRVFQVETNQSVVKVRGTAFNLKAKKDDASNILSVTEGKVTFSPKTFVSEKMVVKGKEATITAGKDEIAIENLSDENLLSWKTRILKFRNTPLQEVARKLEDFYQIRFQISDTGLNKLPFSSTISDRPVDEVVKLLQMASDEIEVTRIAKGYSISKKK